MTTLTDAPARPVPQRSVAERAPKPHLSPEKISATITLAVLVGLAIYSLAEIDISIPNMIASWSNAENFFARVGAITFPEPGHLLYLIAFTVGLVLTGTLLAAVLSVPVAYLAAVNTSPSATWRVIARGFGVLTRAVPDVVLAMVFAMMFSLGALPGILAIGLHSIGMISKMFADAIEQIDEGPRLAIRAAGGTKLQQFTSGVLPQVAPSWIATVLHRNDINLRGSVVLGYVGVAGLGFEMSQSFKSLDYGAGLGIALVIFLLCIVMEIISSAVRAAMLPSAVAKRTWADRLFTRTAAKAAAKREAKRFAPASPEEALRRPWTRARVGNTISLTIAALIVVGAVWVCNINWGDFLTVWGKVPETLAKFWPLDFGAYGPEVLFKALGETIMIALAATLITLLPSLFFGAFAARNVAPTSGVRSLSRLVLVIIRGVPEIILAIVLIVITGLGMQAGTIALALGGIGLLGKLIADSTEEVNPGPERALKATGATRLQVFFSATSPQNVRATIGHTFYLLDTNIRSATILGIVGGGGVGYYLLNASQGSRYGMVSLIVLMILVTVLVCEGLAMWMRRVYR